MPVWPFTMFDHVFECGDMSLEHLDVALQATSVVWRPDSVMGIEVVVVSHGSRATRLRPNGGT